jgi:hypothetical protein
VNTSHGVLPSVWRAKRRRASNIGLEPSRLASCEIMPWLARGSNLAFNGSLLKPMYDARLLGVWRSDARRTLRELRARRDISPKAQRLLGNLVGKLELRFTRARCSTTLDGHTLTGRYAVVAKDASSVATIATDVLGEKQISHIHFEGSRFWISVGKGLFREFFKRVGPSNLALRPSSRARRKADSQKRSRATRG